MTEVAAGGCVPGEAAETPAGCPSQGAPRPPSCRRRLRAVEPVLLLATLALALQAPLSTQLLWDRLAGGNGSRPAGEPGSGCPNHSSAGSGSQAAIYLVVMYAQLPVGYLMVGRVLSGLSGDYNLVLTGCFAYVADVSDQSRRTFRVAVLEACLGLAGMVASVLGGHAAAPHVIMACAGPARGPAWRQRLLYSLAFFVVVTVHFGAREILVLYELGPPLCWGSELIGYGSAALYLTYLSSLVGLRLLQRCLPDAWVAELGLLSNALGLGTMALAGTTALMFTGYGLLFLSMMVTPVIRSKLSRLVGETEQGALFAAVACVEGLCSLVATGAFSSLFPACLSFMRGFPFLFGALLLVVPAAIIGGIEIQDSSPGYQRFGETPEPGQEAQPPPQHD
ncbi:hypothetical protein E2320_018015 [Naja naja]|nr:hypothetical protein E2320_018015 [Naja naja]